MSINAWANDQGALFAVPMTSAMPPDPSNGSWLLQWDPILRQLKYAPFVPPAPEFDFPVPYVGGLAMTVQNQTVEYAGTVYAPVLGTLPFITTGIWATDSAKFRVIQGVTLAEVQALLALKANLESPALTGTPTAPTQATTDNSTQVVNSSWVRTSMANIATAAGAAWDGNYIKLPNWLGGIVFQWGSFASVTDGTGLTSTLYPIAFPAAVRCRVCSNGDPNAANVRVDIWSDGNWLGSPTGIAFKAWNSSGAGAAGIALRINWIAIGY